MTANALSNNGLSTKGLPADVATTGSHYRPGPSWDLLTIRADYCGDGRGWTKNGQRIDIFDVHKRQRATEPASMPLEAAWGPHGAVCVRHTRVREHGDLAAIIAHCPRLASVPVGAICSEPMALSLAGALLFNHSADEALGR